MGRGSKGKVETGMGKWGGVVGPVVGRGRQGRVKVGGNNREGAWGNGKGEMGRGQQEEGRWGRGNEGGVFTDEYDEMPGWTYGMPGWNEATELRK